MYLLENILSALDSIRSNKLRSCLTMLGIIIGVSSVVLMVAIGQGAQQDVTSRIESMGSNLLIVQSGSPNQTDVRSLFRRNNSGTSNSITISDSKSIEEIAFGIKGISPEINSNMQIIVGNQNMQTSVVGATTDYPSVNNFNIEFGRFINEDDLIKRSKVVVLGQEVVSNLFGGQNPIGQDIRLEKHIFTVIGIMESKGQSGFTNKDDIAIIPLNTMQDRINGSSGLSAINISVENQDDMGKIKELVTAILLNEHRITNTEDQDFNILNQAETLETLNEVTQTFTFLLGGIAAISLLVGGIGVMNIMLVSVTERTREIGIRKAIGAKKKDILQQFLVESTVLSLIGGIIGILISISGAWAIKTYLGTSTSVSISSIVLAFTFSMFVGIFFGILPAWKAAKLKPIDALRYE